MMDFIRGYRFSSLFISDATETALIFLVPRGFGCDYKARRLRNEHDILYNSCVTGRLFVQRCRFFHGFVAFLFAFPRHLFHLLEFMWKMPFVFAIIHSLTLFRSLYFRMRGYVSHSFVHHITCCCFWLMSASKNLA